MDFNLDLNYSVDGGISTGTNDNTETDATSDSNNNLDNTIELLEAQAKSLEDLIDDSGDAPDDAESATSSEGLTPQKFMSELNDIASKSEDFGPGERKVLEQAQRLINATPEQKQAYLDKAEKAIEMSDPSDTDASQEDLDLTEISGREAAKLEGFVDGLLFNDESDSSETAEDKPSFMDKVNSLLDGTPVEGDGDDMADGDAEGATSEVDDAIDNAMVSEDAKAMVQEAAKLLEDNPEVDQEAFLAELMKMMDNDVGSDGYDIDENEGFMLKNMAEAFEELPSDRGESSDDINNINTMLALLQTLDLGALGVKEEDLNRLRAAIDDAVTEPS
jgi:hypothetical protein